MRDLMASETFITLLNAILPPRCLSCGSTIGSAGAICARCWTRLRFIARRHCAVCGFPFELVVPETARCAKCLAAPPLYDRARAALIYDPASRALILPFKHGDRLEGVPIFARWMAQAGAELLADADIVTAVPLHRWRLLRRRYNQAAELARALARAAERPFRPDIVRRVRATRALGGLGPAARRKTLHRAFALGHEVQGRRILLIDDVFTTGATASALAHCLKSGGAKAVDVLSLARVVREDPISL